MLRLQKWVMAWWGVSRWPSNGWQVHTERKHTFSPLHAVAKLLWNVQLVEHNSQLAGICMLTTLCFWRTTATNIYMPLLSIALVCSGCIQIGFIISNFPLSDSTPHTWTDFEPFELNPQVRSYSHDAIFMECAQCISWHYMWCGVMKQHGQWSTIFQKY